MTDAVLVTGASTGLGRETALYLAGRGFTVYAGLRDLEKRASLDEVAGRHGVTLHPVQLDITKPDEVRAAVETILDRSGSLFGLVNNAGVGLRGYFEDQSEQEIRDLFEANVFGTMDMTRAVLPSMRSAGRGRIVIITSVGGKIGSMGVSTYCSTKFAQEGFGESLSQEVSPLGIHVSLVEPAIIRTERWGVNRGTARKALSPDSPYSRWFREAERLADRLVESSRTSPESVARAVHQALTAARPRLRYMVGRRAGLVVALRRYMPGELFERIYFGGAVRRVTKAAAHRAAE